MSDYIEDPIDRSSAIHIPSGQMAGRVFIGPGTDHPVRAADLEDMTPIGWAPPFGWDEQQ